MSSTVCLGLDTSNYTTSLALYRAANNTVCQQKRLLPVKEGERGLRQSDALFHHTCRLPELMEALAPREVTCVAVSDRPRETEGSYMPCFLAGVAAARQIATVLQVPLYTFTHQQGHVAAAVYGAACPALFEQRFLAFHVSGGTTDALLVEPHPETVITCRQVAGSLDLKAGQLIDRIGVAMGLSFPAGPALEQLALAAEGMYSPRPSMEGADCHLSGAENQCRARLEKGVPREEVARFCLDHVRVALEEMTARLLSEYGDLPVLYAGGVMSNSILKEALGARFGGLFAPPILSADNAAGIALLGAMKEGL
ncbi:MAG: peptidase M22 [Ruminococcaceae bacterium]|nr:peptidase M22 [Oscillospiraceae bacterium]